MGDAGSLFLGATLAALTIAFQNSALQTLSGPLALAPLLVLLVPIADTALVSLTRLMARRPLDQGGRDHMSHRLVKMGLSEPRAVGLLCVAALLCGTAALGVVWVSTPVGAAIALGLGLLAVTGSGALARVEVGAGKAS